MFLEHEYKTAVHVFNDSQIVPNMVKQRYA